MLLKKVLTTDYRFYDSVMMWRTKGTYSVISGGPDELVPSLVIPYFAGNIIVLVVFFVVYFQNKGFGLIMNTRFPGKISCDLIQRTQIVRQNLTWRLFPTVRRMYGASLIFRFSNKKYTSTSVHFLLSNELKIAIPRVLTCLLLTAWLQISFSICFVFATVLFVSLTFRLLDNILSPIKVYYYGLESTINLCLL